MRRIAKSLLPTPAILAVVCAQVFGMQRGYVCEHQGVAIQTQVEHCHRVAAEAPAFAPCTGDCGEKSNLPNDTEHHTPLSVELQARVSTLGSIPAPMYLPVMMAELPEYAWMLNQAKAMSEFSNRPLTTCGCSPPTSLQVAACVVLLV